MIIYDGFVSYKEQGFFFGGGCRVLNENLLFNSSSYLEQAGAAASHEGISPVKRH